MNLRHRLVVVANIVAVGNRRHLHQPAADADGGNLRRPSAIAIVGGLHAIYPYRVAGGINGNFRCRVTRLHGIDREADAALNQGEIGSGDACRVDRRERQHGGARTQRHVFNPKNAVTPRPPIDNIRVATGINSSHRNTGRGVIHPALDGKTVAAHLHPVLRPEQRHPRQIGVARANDIGGERGHIACQIHRMKRDDIQAVRQRHVVALKIIGRKFPGVRAVRLIGDESLLIRHHRNRVAQIVTDACQCLRAVTRQLDHRHGAVCRAGDDQRRRRVIQLQPFILPDGGAGIIRVSAQANPDIMPALRPKIHGHVWRTVSVPNRIVEIGVIHQNRHIIRITRYFQLRRGWSGVDVIVCHLHP